LRDLGGVGPVGTRTVQRVLEAPQPAAKRATHLGQTLGSKDEQEQDQQEQNVNWIVKTHQ
jgi:hypothetical protein